MDFQSNKVRGVNKPGDEVRSRISNRIQWLFIISSVWQTSANVNYTFPFPENCQIRLAHHYIHELQKRPTYLLFIFIENAIHAKPGNFIVFILK